LLEAEQSSRRTERFIKGKKSNAKLKAWDIKEQVPSTKQKLNLNLNLHQAGVARVPHHHEIEEHILISYEHISRFRKEKESSMWRRVFYALNLDFGFIKEN